jgi:hypothetical protein
MFAGLQPRRVDHRVSATLSPQVNVQLTDSSEGRGVATS